MERASGTDARLDDLSESTRAGFARVDQDIRDLRDEMHQGFAELRTAIQRTNQTLIVGLFGVVVGLSGVIATILARGA